MPLKLTLTCRWTFRLLGPLPGRWLKVAPGRVGAVRRKRGPGRRDRLIAEGEAHRQRSDAFERGTEPRGTCNVPGDDEAIGLRMCGARRDVRVQPWDRSRTGLGRERTVGAVGGGRVAVQRDEPVVERGSRFEPGQRGRDDRRAARGRQRLRDRLDRVGGAEPVLEQPGRRLVVGLHGAGQRDRGGADVGGRAGADAGRRVAAGLEGPVGPGRGPGAAGGDDPVVVGRPRDQVVRGDVHGDGFRALAGRVLEADDPVAVRQAPLEEVGGVVAVRIDRAIERGAHIAHVGGCARAHRRRSRRQRDRSECRERCDANDQHLRQTLHPCLLRRILAWFYTSSTGRVAAASDSALRSRLFW